MQPGFDDSGWTTSLPAPDSYLPPGPYQWTRCRLDLRPLVRTGPVFLQVEEFSAWQLFVDGTEVGSFGNLETGRYSMNLVQRFPLPSGKGPYCNAVTSFGGFFSSPPPRIIFRNSRPKLPNPPAHLRRLRSFALLCGAWDSGWQVRAEEAAEKLFKRRARLQPCHTGAKTDEGFSP
jgi:hypothetical protein